MDSRSGTARSSLLVGLLAALLAAGTLVQAVGSPAPAPAPGSEPATPTTSQVEQTLSSLPLSFIENRGQMDPRVSYYVQGSTTSVYFTSEGVTFSLSGGGSEADSSTGLSGERTLPSGWARSALEGASAERYTLKLDFVGANPEARPIAQDRAPGVVSYFRGSQEDWPGLATFKQIVYPELWPGIDLVYSGTGSSLKYTFNVRPGADPDRIRLAYRGTSGLELNSEGGLEVSTPDTVLTEKAPYTYQVIDGERVRVPSGYAVGSGASEYGFALGDYDPTRPLMIDPVVVIYAGYIGGARVDSWFSGAVAVDGAGSAYVASNTTSNERSFPVKVGPDLTFNGGTDAFVAKLDPSGASLVYAGYIGGARSDLGYGVAVDADGSAYVTGYTDSGEDTFPVKVGPDLTFNGSTDAFVAKLDPSGASLVYAGYIGGARLDSGQGVVVDGAGSAYVTGHTASAEDSFPVKVGPELTFDGFFDAFVAKVEPSGESLAYAGYIGGAAYDWGNGIAVDAAGSAYVAGTTESSEDSFPVVVGPDLTYDGSRDAFVAKMEPSGESLAYAGYIGGTVSDGGGGVAVDAAGNAYVAGGTSSSEDSFPVKVGPDLTYNGSNDAFVAKVEPSGESLAYAGFIGGIGVDGGFGVAVDRAGSAYVTGYTDSGEDTFPVKVGPDLTHNGGDDAFVAKVAPSGESLVYAGYIGGAGDDSGYGIAVDLAGRAFVAGQTNSNEDSFPVAMGPDLTYNGNEDAFVVKIGAEEAPPPACTITGTPQADAISGTSGDDVICALGGNDTVQARGGDDTVFGQGGADTLAGGGGSDTLNGEAGSDILRTTDGIGGNDIANGGKGEDTCIVDEGDATRKCEVVEVAPPS